MQTLARAYTCNISINLSTQLLKKGWQECKDKLLVTLWISRIKSILPRLKIFSLFFFFLNVETLWAKKKKNSKSGFVFAFVCLFVLNTWPEFLPLWNRIFHLKILGVWTVLWFPQQSSSYSYKDKSECGTDPKVTSDWQHSTNT